MGFRAKQQAETSSIRFVDFNNRIEHASTKKVPLCDEKQNPCEKNSINKNIKKTGKTMQNSYDVYTGRP